MPALLTAWGLTLAVVALAIHIGHRDGRRVLWGRAVAVLAAEYAAGVLLGLWPVDVIVAPTRPILDHLLVGGA